ncbi:MAG: hypothetical protein KTR31_09555 [Myxococcales bacterium]|nr:hypothetical protein [Myxococcales bacterium]
MLMLSTLWACTPTSTPPMIAPTPTTSTTPTDDVDGDGFTPDEGDCDDADPNLSPTATDIVGDDIDQNCDGIDGTDVDADGYASLASGGDDCDDHDPEVYPGQGPDCLDDRLGTYFGDLTFLSEDMMDAFCSTYDVVFGDARIAGSGITSLEGLACLRRVAGSMKLQNGTRVTDAVLPNLEEVGSHLEFDGTALASVELPALEHVGGGLWITLNAPVQSMDLPALETIELQLVISAGRLDTVDLPALRSIGLRVQISAEELTTLSAPALETTGDLQLSYTPALDTLDLASLQEVDDLIVYRNDVLVDLDGIPALQTISGALVISSNDSLTDVTALYGVTSFGWILDICFNPKLPTKQIDTLTSIGLANGLGKASSCEEIIDK